MAELSAEQAFAEAQRLLNSGSFSQAGGLSDQLVKAFGAHAPALLLHGIIFNRLGRHHEAIAYLTKAAELLDAPPAEGDGSQDAGLKHNKVTTLFELARGHMATGDLDAAGGDLDRADEIAAERATPIGLTAVLRARLAVCKGDITAAGAIIRPMLDADPVDAEAAVLACELALLDEPVIDRELAVKTAKGVAGRVGLTGEILGRLLRAEGDLLDRMGQHDDAFGAWRRACGLTRSGFDPASFAKSLHGFIRAWTPEQISRIKRADNDDEAPVLVVGVPGRTIGWIGDLIAAHPKTAIAGSLTTLDWLAESVYPGVKGAMGRCVETPARIHGQHNDKAAQAYSGRLRARAQAGEEVSRLVDLNALNSLHLGIVALSCPRARIVRVGGRSMVDTWLDCWSSVTGYAAPFADDPMNLAAFVQGEKTLASHWSRIFADDRVGMALHEFDWAAFVAEPDRVARALIGFLGLEWDDAVGEAARTIAARPMPDPAHYERHLREPAKVLGA